MADKKPKRITFEYKISPSYTVYAINGVYGGLNPHGEILMNIFNERSAIPRSVTHDINIAK